MHCLAAIRMIALVLNYDLNPQGLHSGRTNFCNGNKLDIWEPQGEQQLVDIFYRHSFGADLYHHRTVQYIKTQSGPGLITGIGNLWSPLL